MIHSFGKKGILLSLVFLLCITGCKNEDEDTTQQPLLNTLLLTHGVFEELPLTMDDAVAQGWTNTEHCVPGMGVHAIREVQEEGVVYLPVILVYDIDGRILGFEAESLEEQFAPPWEHAPEGRPGREIENWTLHVYFRDPSDACDPGSGDHLEAGSLGDRMLLTHGTFEELPLNRDDAVAAGWIDTQHCIPGMGVHLIRMLPAPMDDIPDPFVLLIDPDTGDLLGFEFLSLQPQPSPPWEHQPDGTEGIPQEHWTMHVYTSDPRGVCPD